MTDELEIEFDKSGHATASLVWREKLTIPFFAILFGVLAAVVTFRVVLAETLVEVKNLKQADVRMEAKITESEARMTKAMEALSEDVKSNSKLEAEHFNKTQSALGTVNGQLGIIIKALK